MRSLSEDNGLQAIREKHQRIYSVGISTGIAAEMRMAVASKNRRIIATTIDPHGIAFAKEQIEKAHLSEQIEVRLENVADPLPYLDEHFDFIYARLVLHYLTAQQLAAALAELFRVLKSNGNLFLVVRSNLCVEAQDPKASFDRQTQLTTYSFCGHSYSRYFHSEESIQRYLTSAGFSIEHVKTYQERLCVDFQRTQLSSNEDSLIEVLALK